DTSLICALSLHAALPIWERRLVAGLAPAPFQRAEQARFLAADVSPRAPVDDDFLGEIGAENVVAQVAFGARLLDGVLQNPRAQRSEEHTSELQSRENLVC